MRFDNRIVLVTGAGSGIGFETARRFRKAGAHVVACDIRTEPLQAIDDPAGSMEMVSFDLANTASFGRVEQAVAALGRLDVLVNCAGICSGTKLDKLTEQEWDRTYAVNVRGPFFLTQRLLPYLKKGQHPSIVNISSMVSFTGGIQSSPAYSSSKAAVTCMTKNLAKFCAPDGIRVNEVSPGTAKTAMTLNWMGAEGLKGFVDRVPLGRVAEPEDIAGAILFLASEHAGFITGQSLQVNGGMYIP